MKEKLSELINHEKTTLSEAEINWKSIEDAFFDIDVVDEWNLGCMAATIKIETASTFKPIKEYGSQNYFVRNYWDNIKIRKMLGNIMQSDAYNFCGRGFIQLTGRANVTKFANAIHMPDIIQHPDKLNTPHIAAQAAVWYWKNHGLIPLCLQLQKIKPEHKGTLLMEIRRRVNGGLNGFAEFLAATKVLEIT